MHPRQKRLARIRKRQEEASKSQIVEVPVVEVPVVEVPVMETPTVEVPAEQAAAEVPAEVEAASAVEETAEDVSTPKSKRKKVD
jgi:transcription termination factor Rho